MRAPLRLAASVLVLALGIVLLLTWRRAESTSSSASGGSAQASSPAAPSEREAGEPPLSEQSSPERAEAVAAVGAAESDAVSAPTEPASSSREACRVRVVWLDGSPVSGAELRRTVQGEQDELVRTDAFGSAAFDSKDHGAAVVATLDDYASLPVSLSRKSEVVLTLRATVSALGELTPLHGLEPTEVVIHCYALVASRRVHVASARAPSDGSWRMELLPMGEVAQFVFRFEGQAIMPIEREQLARTPGEELRVDVGVAPGTTRAVRVLTTDDEPIEGATVIANYTNILNKLVTYTGVTDANGDCQLQGVPPREGELTASKPGFVRTGYQDLIHAWLPADQVWTLRMPRAPTVRGVCLANGEPVENFDVLWRPPFPVPPDRFEFRDAENGAFTLDQLEPGRVCLIAVSDEHGQSAPLYFDLPQDGIDGLVLEFDARVSVKGEVIDAVSEAPIADAVIQPWSSTPSALYGARGQAFSVDSSGRFSSSDFNVGINRFEVSAPGYASRMLGVHAKAGEEASAGAIRLGRTQPLDLEFRPGPDLVVTECYATGVAGAGNTGVLATAVFDANGRTRFDSVAPGDWTIRVMLSNGYELYSQVSLVPGAPWSLLIDHASLSAWQIQFRTGAGEPAPGCTAFALWSDAGVTRTLGAGAKDDGRARVFAPKNQPLTLRIHDAKGVWLRDVDVGPVERAQDPFEVLVDDDRPMFRVTDGTGAPLAGVNVFALSRQFGYSQSRSAQTDASGMARLFEAGDVSFTHSTHGLGVRLGLSKSDQRAGVYELKLDPGGPLELSVRDGAFVVAGAELKLGTAGYWLSRPRTDSMGVAKTIPLNAGRWDVRMDLPGYWPTQASFEVVRGVTAAQLQVRRLGDVAFEVRSASGAPVEGLEVELLSEEFNERAGDWLAKRRISASNADSRVDARGKLELRGLPHGKYRWSIVGRDGVLATNEVELAPRARVSVEARVP